jgi:NAD-dependent deacetylase
MDAPIVVLTGAGVSAESGIPTFRGKEGYWTVGSREYHPQELGNSSRYPVLT